MLRLAAAVLLSSSCYGVRIHSDVWDVTPSYASRFGNFSLADVTKSIKEQMCEIYLAKPARGLLHLQDTTCAEWVEESVTIEDGPLITASAGDPADPLVLFIHGYPDNPALWVNQFVAFSDRYHCLAVQLPNYLDALPTEEVFVNEVVDRIGEVLAGRRAYLIAHDWGSNFAYMVAYKFPDLISKMVSLDIANDVQIVNAVLKIPNTTNNIPFWKIKFMQYYMGRLAGYYRNPRSFSVDVGVFGYAGGAPNAKKAAARMGMYYDQLLNRTLFTQKVEPGVPANEWGSAFTPLGGTGIPQSGMLFISGSSMFTTQEFINAVEADGGRALVTNFGHWLPVEDSGEVTAELDAWLSGSDPDKISHSNSTIPHNYLAWTECSTLILKEVYGHGYVFAGKMRPGRNSFGVGCAGSDLQDTGKILCNAPRVCHGHEWCFVRKGCSERWGRCSALPDQDPLKCRA